MTKEQIAELRKLETEATPGPWSTRKVSWRGEDEDCCDGIFAPAEPTEYGPVENEVVTTDSGVYGPDWSTAQFIVAARNALPQLLDEREALLEALRAIEWGGDSFQGFAAVCPDCVAHEGKPHEPDCVLAAALAKAESP